MKITPKDYYPALDGVRAIAVLAVIFFHLEFDLFSGGYVGVDMFFVISGYLITRNICLAVEVRTFSILAFYAARARRLIPALLVTVTVSLLGGVLLYSPDGLIRLSGSAIAGLLSLANIRFWINSGYFDTDSISKPLLHLWSLSVEEQFYLFWPIILLLCFSVIKRRWLAALILCSIVSTSFIASVVYLDSNPNTVFYWMPFRVYEFGIGGLFACVELVSGSTRQKLLINSNFVTAFGVALVLSSAIFFNDLTPFPGFYSLLPCVGTLCLIISRDSLLSSYALANKVMRKIGKISYSLYLVHWPLWVFISFWSVTPLSLIQKIFVFVLNLVLGWALYAGVEKRFRYSTSGSSDRIFFCGLLFFTLIVLAGSHFFRTSKGLPQRMAEQPVVSRFNEHSHCEYPNGDKSLRVCSFGERQAPKRAVLLIGDSHAMNLANGLGEFGLRHQTNFYAYSAAGCAPLLDVDIFKHEADQAISSCQKFSEELTGLISDERFDVVMISARWGWYFEDEEYVQGQKIPLFLMSDSESVGRNRQQSRIVWQRSLSATIALASDKGKRVVVFSQYPLLQKGIGECDKSPNFLISRSQVQARCKTQIPYKTVMQRLAFMNKVVSNSKDAGVLPVLPSDYFCNHINETCDVFTNRGLWYADENHISALGSRHLIESIDAQLSEFILAEGGLQQKN